MKRSGRIGKKRCMDKPPATVTVNGQEMAAPESRCLNDLLKSLQLDPRFVLVELNGEALFKEQIPQASLRPGDRLEIVKPVAGG